MEFLGSNSGVAARKFIHERFLAGERLVAESAFSNAWFRLAKWATRAGEVLICW